MPADDSDPEDLQVEMKEEIVLHRIKPTYKRGIRHIAKIWVEVQLLHIMNCWQRAGIKDGVGKQILFLRLVFYMWS